MAARGTPFYAANGKKWPWKMAHRNRWFTWVYLLKMVDLSMAMLNNQMV